MGSFFASLPTKEQRLLDVATELREARQAAQAAALSGSLVRMQVALARLQAAKAAVLALQEEPCP